MNEMDDEFQISNDFDQNYYGYHDNRPASTTTNISISAVISASCIVMDDCYHSYPSAPDFQATSESFQYPQTNYPQWKESEYGDPEINTLHNNSSYDQNYHENYPKQIWDYKTQSPFTFSPQNAHLERQDFECPFFDDNHSEVGHGISNESELEIRHLNSNNFENQFLGVRKDNFRENSGKTDEINTETKHERVVSLCRWENETPAGPCSVSCSRTKLPTDHFQESYYDQEMSNETNDILPLQISPQILNHGEEETKNYDSGEKVEVDVDYMLSNGVTVAGFKPRPIIRKKKKRVVIQDEKDMNYWNRRSKNNDSARRSRETKKEKERLFYKQALQYEYENYFLKERIIQLETQLGITPSQNVREHQQHIL